METLDERQIQFIRHIHLSPTNPQEKPDYELFHRKMPLIEMTGSSHCYWYGFSFRPSLIRIEE